jgi:hypothetical protein
MEENPTDTHLKVLGIRDLLTPPILPAGDAREQLRLGALARAMLEERSRAALRSADPLMRLAASWLAAHRWTVQLVPFDIDDAAEEVLCAAIARRGHRSLVGAVVDPVAPGPSAVWRLPPERLPLRRFLGAFTGSETVLFPADRSLALLSDGEEMIAVAGPRAFVLDAVGAAAAAAPRRFEEHRRGAEVEYGQGCFLDTLHHYAPFALDPAG